ncbi:DUF2079 domain-containing protein [Corallococcus sp. AB050B]|nr:DUF2079 domain-containing protein [Corallococcus sp. AB050B]
MTHSPEPSALRRFAARLLLPLTFAIWGVVCAVPMWAKNARYCFWHYDMGIYTQALARLSFQDPNPWLSARQVFIFNDHFDPVLWLARPLVTGLSPSQAAVVAECLAVLLSTAPILWLHHRKLLDRGATFLLCTLLLLNSGVQSAMAYPVHPTTWAVFPWTLLAVAYCLRRPGWMLFALALLFSCKEEFPFAGVMLAGGLAWRGERRAALAVGVLTVAWLAFVFAGRPALMGPVVDYGGRLLPKPGQPLTAFLSERLTPRHLSNAGSMLLIFVPLALWAWREKWRPDAVWLSVLLPMLGIRFLGMAWRDHYGAPLLAAAAMVPLPLLLKRRPPVWVLAGTALLLLTTNESVLRRTWRAMAEPESFPAYCPDTPQRLASVGQGVKTLLENPEGRVLLSGNLVAPLAARNEIYAVDGPQPPGTLRYAWVLVEKPGGNTIPTSPERMEELIARWRKAPDTRLLIDDAHVFFAQGDFSLETGGAMSAGGEAVSEPR